MIECLREEPVQSAEKWLLTVVFIVWTRRNLKEVRGRHKNKKGRQDLLAARIFCDKLNTCIVSYNKTN